jgi:small-conductance mechanosensitive channel/CRP-like cAMP-binding protein
MTDLLETDWFLWGLGLILGFQVLVVMLGELLYRADRGRRPIAPILRTARNAVLPLLVIYVFVVRVLEAPPEAVPVRIITTALWISLLYSGLLLVNVLVFEQAPEGSWRHRAPSLFQDLVRMLLIVVGAAIVLAVVWEQDLGGLIAALGVGSIVLGLALQETLGNLMSGIALLFEKPFTIGDWIEVGDDQGEVVEINWRSVHVRTRERNLLVFPNSVLGRETIVNYARPTSLQTLRLSFGFSLDDPPNKVKAVLLSVAEEMETVLSDPPPRALAREVQDDRIRYETFLFIDQPRLIPQIVDAYTSRVWYACQRAGIQLPLPAAHEYQIHADHLPVKSEEVDIASELSRAQGFDALEAADISGLAQQATVQHFGDGEQMLRTGEVADGVFVIIRGQVRAVLAGEGEAVVEVPFGEREVVGVTSLARREPSQITVTADGDVTVIRLGHEVVDEAIHTNPALALQFARIMEIREEVLSQAREMLIAGIDDRGNEKADAMLPVSFKRPQSEPDEDDDD